jgi:hypothetical protein
MRGKPTIKQQDLKRRDDEARDELDAVIAERRTGTTSIDTACAA